MSAAKAPTPTDITCSQCTKATGRQAETGGKRQGPVESGRGDLVLGDLMHDVSRLRRLIFDESMRPLGLTRSQWWVLDCLSRSDGMIQSDLANTLGLGKAALGGLVDRLELAGFVCRRADDSDRRAKRVYLAAHASGIIEGFNEHGRDINERILAGISDDERSHLASMLGRIKANLLALKSGQRSGSGLNGDD